MQLAGLLEYLERLLTCLILLTLDVEPLCYSYAGMAQHLRHKMSFKNLQPPNAWPAMAAKIKWRKSQGRDAQFPRFTYG